jgi:general secretion pathway protein A
MYSHHFGLTQDPFSIAPDPRYLFMSERHREALAHLLYGVTDPQRAAGGTGGGFVLLTGDIGTGKTTICRCFLEQIPPGCHVAYIFNPKLTVTELLQSICEEFHITAVPLGAEAPTVKTYIDALNTFLLQSHAAGESSVLIIDEAQNLSADVLEQLRLLTNLETNERKLLQIVLIGQPELRSMLARPELEQLAQRVIARFHLDALSDAEAMQYITHRLAVAGHSGPLPFDRKSLERIQRLARGVPRRINLLCGRALLGAWANGLLRVDRSVVDKAAAEVFGPDHAPGSSINPKRTAYLLGGLVLLLGALVIGLLQWNPKLKTSPALPAALPARPASAATPPRPEPPVQSKVEALDALLPQLPGDLNTAWRALANNAKLPATLSASDADPCLAAVALQWQCYRTSKLSVPLLRQLKRPGILTLQEGHAAPLYAVLVSLDDQSATLQIGSGLHRVRLVALAQLWSGDFATYWQAPAGYQANLREGSSGPAIELLARQLGQLDGAAAAPSAAGGQILDSSLRERLRTFQRAQGIKPDGLPGPMTFMQLASATAAPVPQQPSAPH